MIYFIFSFNHSDYSVENRLKESEDGGRETHERDCGNLSKGLFQLRPE